MQTFLPYPDFERTAAVLDDKRLGKQRVETYQILKALVTGSGWVHHPAVKMWHGYEGALLDYQHAIVFAWVDKGYADTCLPSCIELLLDAGGRYTNTQPPWLGSEEFHLAHRSNLVRKLPEHYAKLWPDVPDDLDYVWPVAS